MSIFTYVYTQLGIPLDTAQTLSGITYMVFAFVMLYVAFRQLYKAVKDREDTPYEYRILTIEHQSDAAIRGQLEAVSYSGWELVAFDFATFRALLKRKNRRT